MKYIFAVALLFIPFLNKAETIKIAAIDWCPQICPKQPHNPGYVFELVNTVYKNGPYQIKVDYFPWSRAIKNVLTGQYHALLSPAKAEAPQLRYPAHDVGQQAMCFFTKKDNSWRYAGTPSLEGKQIGIAIDTSIEELNDYVASHLEQFQFQPYHERYISQNAKKLDKGRIDSFLFTYNSTRYELMKEGVWHHYQEAGCVSNAPIYIGFTPDPTKYKEVSEMIKYFDDKMTELGHYTLKDDLLKQYGLR